MFNRQVDYFTKALQRYGTVINVFHRGRIAITKAIVQPYTKDFQRKYGGDSKRGNLGNTLDYDLLAHLAPTFVIEKGDIVQYRGKKYVVVDVGEREFSGCALYKFAVIRERIKEEDEYYDNIHDQSHSS